jgi:predicted amidophosphoribosyltransferase
MLFPRACVGCDRPDDGLLCAECRAQLRPAPDLGVPEGLDRLWALVAYEGAGRELVTAFKYHQRREVAQRLAPALGRLVDERFDLVTWLPTSAARRRARGYDQARLLARALAPSVARGAARPLLRRRPGPAQTGRPAAARAGGPALVARRVPAGARVLVVDDVVTTGASMRSAALALQQAGAAAVSGAALARTPLKEGTRSVETTHELRHS